MPTYTLQIPQSGLPNSTEDPKVASSLTTLQTALSAGLDTVNLSPTAGIVAGQLAIGAARFSPVIVGTSATLTDGQAAICSPSTTITLPAAAAGAWCAVVPGSTVTGSTPVTVQRTGSDVIYTNSSTVSVTSLTQGAPLASLIFYAYASGSWVLISGLADTGWVAIPLSTNWSVAGTQPASYRVLGNMVYLAGAAQNGTGGGSSTPFASPVPVAMRPLTNGMVVVTPGNDAAVSFLSVGTTGTYVYSLSIANGATAFFDGVSYHLAV